MQACCSDGSRSVGRLISRSFAFMLAAMKWRPRARLVSVKVVTGACLMAFAALAAEPVKLPRVEIHPKAPRPGDPVLVTVRDLTSPPTGSIAGQELVFWPVKGGFRAIAALPVEQEAGSQTYVFAGAEAARLEARFEVRPASWRDRKLRVEPKFTEPDEEVRKRIESDREAFAKAFDQPVGAPLFTENFLRPREAVVTAPFGDRRTFNGVTKSQHYGLDLDGKVGEPVVASNAGRVVLVRDCHSSGQSIVVDHGAGIFTVYFHLSEMNVEEGQSIQRGQLIGAVGATGRVTGPHLHFGVRIQGRYVDPETVLQLPFEG